MNLDILGDDKNDKSGYDIFTFFYTKKAIKKALDCMEQLSNSKSNEIKELIFNKNYKSINKNTLSDFWELLNDEARICLVMEQVKSSTKFRNIVKRMFVDDVENLDLSGAKLQWEHSIVLYQANIIFFFLNFLNVIFFSNVQIENYITYHP